jgi:hypothetical protein
VLTHFGRRGFPLGVADPHLVSSRHSILRNPVPAEIRSLLSRHPPRQTSGRIPRYIAY